MDNIVLLFFIGFVFIAGVGVATIIQRRIVKSKERHYPPPEALHYVHEMGIRARQLNEDARELEERAARLRDLLTSKQREEE